MPAALRQNVERLREARGLSRAELSRRVGMAESSLRATLAADDMPPAPLIAALASQLLVPDFLLRVEQGLNVTSPLIDFRQSEPNSTGYDLKTLKAIEAARTIQREAARVGSYQSDRSLRASVSNPKLPLQSARELRDLLNISDESQLNSKDARTFYSFVRSRIESRETIILQNSFRDGSGFCLSGDGSFDVICINTYQQNYPRRLFTLAHEAYHCISGRTGLSDPDCINNALEIRCNKFAIELLAPLRLVVEVARTIFRGSSQFDIDRIRQFSSALKLSMHASVLRLIEADILEERARAEWARYVASLGNPDFNAGGGGGRRVEEWKYKLAKYGFLLPQIFGEALEEGKIDQVGIYRSSGIKPKYQREFFANAFSAAPEDAEDE